MDFDFFVTRLPLQGWLLAPDFSTSAWAGFAGEPHMPESSTYRLCT